MLKLKRADEINTSKKARVLFCSHPNDFNQMILINILKLFPEIYTP